MDQGQRQGGSQGVSQAQGSGQQQDSTESDQQIRSVVEAWVVNDSSMTEGTLDMGAGSNTECGPESVDQVPDIDSGNNQVSLGFLHWRLLSSIER